MAIRRPGIRDKVSELGVELPPEESFWRLGDLTALRRDPEGRFYRSNYDRGILLYAMVARYRPRVILEFGTGRGYGALCMARAAVECGLDSLVYSIDRRQFDEKLAWPIDYESGPVMETLSLSDVWSSHCPPEWVDRVRCLTGSSVEIIRKWKSCGLPDPELAYIDGGHDYDTVKHDFYGMLHLAAPPFRVLFDDYADRPGFGICRLVDEELAPVFAPEVVVTGSAWHPSEAQQGPRDESAMVFINSDLATAALEDAFPQSRISGYLSQCRRDLRVRRATRPLRAIIRPLARRFNAR